MNINMLYAALMHAPTFPNGVVPQGDCARLDIDSTDNLRPPPVN